MRGVIHQIAVVAGAAAMLFGSAVGIAAASEGLSWSPTTSPGTYSYGTVNAGQTVSQVFTLTNSGIKATSALRVGLTRSAVFTIIRPDGCTGTTLAPNQSCTVTVTFAPARPSQTYKATLTAANGRRNALLTLTGTSAPPVVLSWSPTTSTGSYSYGTVNAGQTVPQVFTLTNSGIKATSALRVGLTRSAVFTIIRPEGCTGTTLAPNQSCTVTVTFAPARPSQTYKATLTAVNGRVKTLLTLTGTSAPPVVLSWSPTTSPGAYSYGTVTAGQTVPQTFTLTNSGIKAASPHITLTRLSAFKQTNNCLRITLGQGQSCSVTVTFAPATGGQTYQATLTAASGRAASASLTLTGAGIKASPAISTTAGAGGPVGATVADTAALSGGSAPGGSIEFKLYGPSATADCSGTPVDDETVSVSGNGSYTTLTGATPTQAGTYWWTASYIGDPNNNPAATNCGDEQVTIGKAAPAITTSPSAGGLAGTAVTDTATLSGGSAPGGSIEFKLYGPSATADCSGTPVDDETVSVSGNGSYTTLTGATPTQAGTYWWTASYIGDPNNNPAATNCGDEQVTTTAAAHIYWSEYLGSTIMEANLDGTGVQTLISVQAQDGPYGVAVDSNHIYWSIPGGGTIMEANLDGSNPQTLISGQSSTYGVAVDSSHIYWANDVGGNGTIMEANLDGTSVQALVSGLSNPGALAVDSSHIYWSEFGGTIMEANLDGSNPQTLVTGQADLNYPNFIAVGSGHIYWTDIHDGTITEANLDGTGVQTLISGQATPYGVAVDSNHIFWADRGNGPGEGTIMEANLDGTGVQTLVSGQSFPYGLALGPQ